MNRITEIEIAGSKYPLNFQSKPQKKSLLGMVVLKMSTKPLPEGPLMR